MKKNTETAKIPMINQVLKDAALGHLAECGLPQSLISGVDCSSYERMGGDAAGSEELLLFFRKKEYRRHLRPILPGLYSG